MGNARSTLELTIEEGRPFRLDGLDMLRGFAVFLMLIFHFCFDLAYFDIIDMDFYNSPFWLNFRTVIVTLFVLVSGVSLALAAANGIDRRSIVRRLALLTLAASIVTIATFSLFGERVILFGILHFLVVASIFAIPFFRLYKLNLIFGVALILIGTNFSSTLFDLPWLQWLGMMTFKPATEDYVPVVPWFGVILIGHFLGKTYLRQERPLWARVPSANLATRALRAAGQHSLAIYLIHQPILFGLIWTVLNIGGP